LKCEKDEENEHEHKKKIWHLLVRIVALAGVPPADLAVVHRSEAELHGPETAQHHEIQKCEQDLLEY
jgi:hypothetical protein